MIKRSWRMFLASAAIAGGLSVSGSAFAGEGCCTSVGGLGCEECEQLFAENNQQLTDQLAAMSCCHESCCDSSVLCGEPSCGEGCLDSSDDSCVTIGGWVQMGYHNRAVPLGGAAGGGSFNNHPHRFNLHQGWLFAEKIADGSNGWDWGFRADVMYGVDAADTQSFGNTPGRFDFGNEFNHGQYGFAIPQLYTEVANGDLSVKIGHFYTLIGYEVVTAPDNFFYSHALTMFNSEPFTHTGLLATYSVSDDTDVYAGWTLGWDTGFDRFREGSNFLGGFSTALAEDVTLTYIATAGEFGWRGNGYSHSIVLDFALTDDLNYVIQSDVVRTNDHDGNNGTYGRDDDIGINQYLLYQINDMLAAGTRVEWWRNEGASQYAATFGVNIKPTDNLIFRPEIRHDWDAPVVGSNTSVGMDAIWTF